MASDLETVPGHAIRTPCAAKVQFLSCAGLLEFMVTRDILLLCFLA